MGSLIEVKADDGGPIQSSIIRNHRAEAHIEGPKMLEEIIRGLIFRGELPGVPFR